MDGHLLTLTKTQRGKTLKRECIFIQFTNECKDLGNKLCVGTSKNHTFKKKELFPTQPFGVEVSIKDI